MRLLILVIICCIGNLGSAQEADCAAIRQAKSKTYNFHPTKVDEKTRQAKSKEMDSFWKLVKGEHSEGIVCLRQMLSGEPTGSFFLFDGASLLISLDKSDASLKASKEAVERADLSDVDPAGYMSMLIQLGLAGVDTGRLAITFLKSSDVTAVVPQHAMTLDRASGAILIFGSMPYAQVDKYLVPALNDSNPNLRAIAALVLAINMTDGSFQALSSFGHFAELPAGIKEEVDAYRKYTPLPQDWKAKFTREQVLTALHRIPSSMEEYEKALAEEDKAREQYEAQHPAKGKDEKSFMQLRRAFDDEFGPYTSLAGHDTFIHSAMLTLTEEDLPFLREERRKQVRMSDEAFYEWAAYTRIIEGVINRLDLYKQYRIH